MEGGKERGGRRPSRRLHHPGDDRRFGAFFSTDAVHSSSPGFLGPRRAERHPGRGRRRADLWVPPPVKGQPVRGACARGPYRRVRGGPKTRKVRIVSGPGGVGRWCTGRAPAALEAGRNGQARFGGGGLAEKDLGCWPPGGLRDRNQGVGTKAQQLNQDPTVGAHSQGGMGRPPRVASCSGERVGEAGRPNGKAESFRQHWCMGSARRRRRGQLLRPGSARVRRPNTQNIPHPAEARCRGGRSAGYRGGV